MKLTNKKRDQIAGISFVLLPIIGIFLFVGIPLIVSLVLSFGHLPSFDIFDIDFTNFGSNYIRIFLEDNKYIRAVINSFVYAIGTSLIQTILSLLLAYFLSKPIKCRTMFRVILFIPYVCSVVALSLMWKWMLDGNFGIINDYLMKLGLEKVDWLNNPKTSFGVIITMSVWGGLGYGTILYTAALSSVDKTLYEASEVDGASSFHRFRHITLPMISPTTFYVLVMGMIGNLQAFANFQVMKPIGNDGQIETMVYRVWWAAFEADFQQYGIGYASALGWVSGIIIILFTVVLFKTQKYWVHYEN